MTVGRLSFYSNYFFLNDVAAAVSATSPHTMLTSKFIREREIAESVLKRTERGKG
jgi:hypothetical protein